MTKLVICKSVDCPWEKDEYRRNTMVSIVYCEKSCKFYSKHDTDNLHCLYPEKGRG